MFADDASLIKSGKRVDPLLSQEISCVREWFSSNNMTVHHEKCEAMCFGYGNSTRRLNCKRRSRDVALYVKDCFKPISFNTEIECSLTGIRLEDNNTKKVCVIYRPDNTSSEQVFGSLRETTTFSQLTQV